MVDSQAFYAATEGVPAADLISDLLALMELRSMIPNDVASGRRTMAVLRRLGKIVNGRRARIDYERNGLVVGGAFVGLRELEQVVDRLQLRDLQAA